MILFPLDVIAYSGARYGEGSGPVYFDNIDCLGNESRLTECTYISGSACPHSQDAGVQCRDECKNEFCFTAYQHKLHSCNSYVVLCNNSDIRLAGGSDQYEGRVEVCFNETWGTICDGSWSTNDANVACRQLGYAATGSMVG